MSRKPLSCFIALLVLMTVWNCRQQRELQPLENYYGYQLADSISLRLLQNRSTDVLLGIDKDSLQLAATAVDQQGKPIPDALFTYLVDGVPLPSNTFLPAREGQYIIEARLGKAVSKPIPIQAIDPRNYIKSLKLSVTLSHGEFIADNYTQTLLKTELLDAQGKPFPFNLSQAVKYLVNGQEIRDSTFRTDKPGTYTFQAVLFDKGSNEVSVKALTLSEAGIVTLPIIFHLINVDIPVARLQRELDKLNLIFRDAYTIENVPKGSRHADLRLRFILAETDPTGKRLSEPGRDIIDEGKPQYTYKEINESLAWKHYWNPDFYLNVFLANFENDYMGGNWGGLAYYPSTTGSLPGLPSYPKGTQPKYLFCTFLRYESFTVDAVTPLAHELGHMLGLMHAFNENDCNSDSDHCEDTPMYNRSFGSNAIQSNKRTACNGAEIFSTNFMDYLNAGNANMFTVDQGTRVRHIINYGLWLPTPFNGRTNPGGDGLRLPGM